MVLAVVVILSEEIVNVSTIVSLHSPGVSTLHWGTVRGLLCVTSLVMICCEYGISNMASSVTSHSLHTKCLEQSISDSVHDMSLSENIFAKCLKIN